MDLLTRPNGPVVGVSGFRAVPSTCIVIRRLVVGLAIGLATSALGPIAHGQSAVEGRPQVSRSSAESHAAALPDLSGGNVQVVLAALGASQLDFFDDLERQPLVCHDDALHACLLLGAGINATTFEQRVAMAAQMGWIAPNFDRPAREAATVGEVAKMAAGILDGRTEGPSLTQEQALSRVARVSPIPSTLRPYQGITGAQLLSILGGVHDAMTATGEAEGMTPTAATAPAAPTAPVSPVAPVAPAAPAVAETPRSTQVPVVVEPALAPSQPTGSAVEIVDVTPGGVPAGAPEAAPNRAPMNGVVEGEVAVEQAVVGIDRISVDLPADARPSGVSLPTEAAAHEPVIALDDRIGPRTGRSGSTTGDQAGVEAGSRHVVNQGVNQDSGRGAEAPAAEEPAVRTSQFVPGKPLRRPTQR